MLTKCTPTALSFFEGIYDVVVPQDHVLRKLANLCDFAVIYDELKDKYSIDNGAIAISPILLFKYLLLKVMYGLSDVDVVERSRYDMSFKFFLGLQPEEDVIHPSTLSKFRTLRLKDANLLDLLLNQTISIALAKGVIKKDVDLIIDSMHISARPKQRTPEMILSSLAKNLRRSIYATGQADKWKARFPKKVDGKDIGTLIQYCHELIDLVKNENSLEYRKVVQEQLHHLEEVVAEAELPETEEHTYLQPLDPDAGLGHKSKYNSFYGYKDHYVLTTNRIIVGAVLTAGQVNDGGQLRPLIEKVRKAGLHVNSVIGDMAYSGKDNLAFAESVENPENSFKLVAKLNPIISAAMLNQERDGFTYNKDAKLFTCPRGRMADGVNVSMSRHNVRRLNYRFNATGCVGCPHDGTCHKKGKKSRVYTVTVPSELHKKQQEYQESPEFKELMKHRYKIEAKNSELKHVYGLEKAESTRLIPMSIQGAVAMFAANMKRIMVLEEENKG